MATACHSEVGIERPLMMADHAPPALAEESTPFSLLHYAVDRRDELRRHRAALRRSTSAPRRFIYSGTIGRYA